MYTANFYDNSIRKTMVLDADIHWDNKDYPFLHDHKDFWEFWVVTDGKCCHHINGKNHIMQKCEGILLRPKDCHYAVKTENGSFSHINFAIRDELIREYLSFLSPSLCDELLKNRELFFTLSSYEYDKLIKYVTTFLTELQEGKNTSRTSRLLCSFIFEAMLSERLKKANSYPDWICDLIYEINKPENLSAFAGDIIKTCNYSHQHILRVFKKCTGKNLTSYINSVKCNAASELIAQNKYTMLEIANMLGFDSLSYFDHLFKKEFGMSPKQYEYQKKNMNAKASLSN